MGQRWKTSMMLACALLSGCDARVVADLSDEPPYRQQIGARYEVIGDLVAYGVKIDLQKPPDYITLIPPPGISGPEIAFTLPVVRGSDITILKIVKTNRLLDPGLTLFVRMTGTPMPVDLPVRVDLLRGNEGSKGALVNPAIFRRRGP